MLIEDPSEGSLPRMSLLRRGPDPVPARGELEWNEDGGVTKAAAQSPQDVSNMSLDPEPMPHAVVEEAPIEVIDATAGALASEIARRRAEGLERLDAEMRTRRAELMQSLELQRAEAERRIAETEQLEREAISPTRRQ